MEVITMSFNSPAEQSRNRYEPFFGRNTEQMPKLLADNREPMAEDFFQRRIDVLNLYQNLVAVEGEGRDEAAIKVAEAVRNKWWNTYADVAHLWVRHPDKGGKIVPYDGKNGKVMEVLRQITPQAKLVDHALPLPDDFYEAVDGEYVVELKPAEIERLHGKYHQHGTNTYS